MKFLLLGLAILLTMACSASAETLKRPVKPDARKAFLPPPGTAAPTDPNYGIVKVQLPTTVRDASGHPTWRDR